MQHRQIIAVCFENHKKHTNTLCEESLEFFTFCVNGKYSSHWGLKGSQINTNIKIRYKGSWGTEFHTTNALTIQKCPSEIDDNI